MIKARKVADREWDEYLDTLIKPQLGFITTTREKLAKRASKRSEDADEADAELKQTITLRKKLENVKKMFYENYLNDDEKHGSCSMCKHRFKCKAKVASKIIDKNGDLLPPAYIYKTKYCSLFHPLVGKKTDYPMFTEAHSTTVTVTDLSLSCNVYYDPGFVGNWNTVWSSINGTMTTHNNFAMIWSFSGGKYRIYRSACIFDLTALPAAGSVMDAKIQLYRYSVYTADNVWIRIQDGGVNPSDPVNIAAYNQALYSGSYGDTNCNTHVTNAYNDFDFSNYTTINMGGKTRHMLRERDFDIGNLPPANLRGWPYECVTHAGGNDPKIEITYATAVAVNPHIDAWYSSTVSPY